MPKQRKTENYSDDLNYMADLAIELNMAGGQSKVEILDVLGRMKDNQPRMFKEFQADISQEQIRKDRMRAENEERSEKRRMDTKEKDRTKKRLESFRKDKKGKAAMIGGLSKKMNRGGLATSGRTDFRKKGLFY